MGFSYGGYVCVTIVRRSAMTALRGGAADKAGNEYEDLWTAIRVADLLHGQAHRIRLEPPGDAGVGVEFEVDVAGRTWGEQTKNVATTWTIARLKKGDASGRISVLAGAKHQIELGRGYRLITSSTANPLLDLSNRARATLTIAEFKDELTEVLRPDFATIVDYWAVTEEVAWRLLKDIVVEHHPTELLRRTVWLAFRTLYAGDPNDVLDAVGRFCSEHRHENISAPQVAAFLKPRFIERLLAGDDTVRRMLHRTLERHQRRVQHAKPSFGFVPRSEAQAIIDKLDDVDSPQIVVVDGPAGYGKSAVVAEIASTLDQRGWFVAVARMDTGTAMPTSDHLGEQMGLSESPSVLLAGVADGLRGLLVVDQLDAVSYFSGRMPDSFDAVDEIRDELQRVPNLKLLLVVRTVDLENDPRLRFVLHTEGLALRHTLQKLSADQVREQLRQHGCPVPVDATVELLCTPLHFAVFSHLSEEARRHSYLTLQDLYDRLTTEARKRATNRAGHMSWAAITSTLVAYMSEQQTLAAPRALLDEFPLEEIASLESEAILVTEERGVSFFHESYFDYLFARAFVTRGDDLHEFLTNSGQFLFRRAQTRQVVEYLAAQDRQRFRDVVTRLLGSPSIRSHIKQVVVGVLRQLTPTATDWDALEDIAWREGVIGRSVLSLLSAPQWFDSADHSGRWEAWLADPNRVEAAAQQLISVATERGQRVAELFRRYTGTNEEWRLRLRALISWSMCPPIVPLAIELIEGGHVDDARGPIAVNSDFWSIVAALEDDDPVGAARLIGAYLKRGLARAHADGASDPFASKHLARHSQGHDVIQHVAEKVPKPFICEVLPFIAELSNIRLQTQNPSLRHWGRPLKNGRSVDDTIFAAVEEALQSLAISNPQAASEAISPYRNAASEALRFLVCRTLTASPDSDDAIDWLIADQRNLMLGWYDSPRYASYQLIAAHSARCAEQLCRQLETEILRGDKGFRPHHGQVALLYGIDPERMSTAARRRLEELKRLFVGPPPSPAPIVASFVGPPISSDASKRMGDKNWLSALRKHTSEHTRERNGVTVGGASNLAQVLGTRANEDPERFARLALHFDSSIPMTAIKHVIQSVGSNIDPALFALLCEHALTTYGDEVSHAVCTAISDFSAIDDRLISLVDQLSISTDPNPEHTSADLRDPYITGLRSTRGSAALAVAAALFQGAQHLDRLLTLVRRLANDPSVAVRTCASHAVAALLNHDQSTALNTAERLFDAPLIVFDTPATERLLTYCLLRSPTRFIPHLQRALEGPTSIATRAGRVWAVAHHRGAIAHPISEDVRTLATPSRLGAAQVLAENIADSSQELTALFADRDPDVREAASAGLRKLSDVQPNLQDGLVDDFLASPAFTENIETLIDGLENLGTRLPRAALQACEKGIETAGTGLGSLQGRGSYVGREITTIVLRLYRQADEITRTRCLDIIDRLFDLNAYGLDKALAEER
ncbi:hypothetical protein [Nocardia abscessus]|uniref:hypothetical protein n=1 Tax=Nocardia abscessus TaxID=120957 RepID=UPI0024544FD8|nr:hypothetical protein [Nocardia abscessus]